MVITGRAALLALLGLPLTVLAPTAATPVLWTVAVTAACALDAALAASPRRVEVRRTDPGTVRLTGSARSVLTVRNLGRRRLRALMRDAWQPSAGADANRHVRTIEPGEASRTTTRLLPSRRGELSADRVTIRSFGPLGLAARQAGLPVPGRLRVLPEFAARRHLPSRLARLRELDGRTAAQVRGEGTEFDSLREYVLGDDVRSLDWRASARRQELVVRTWRPERDRRVLIVLDTGRTSAARVGGAPRLDASVEAALLLSALVSHAGDRVEVLAYDRAVRAHSALDRGTAVMARVADALAPVEPRLQETDWPGLAELVLTRLSQRALVVLLSACDPSAVGTGLLRVAGRLAARHEVVLASVSDPELAGLRRRRDSSTEVFDAAAAERAELERAAVAALLRGTGVEVLDELPEQLAPRLADAYLALKAAGRL